MKRLVWSGTSCGDGSSSPIERAKTLWAWTDGSQRSASRTAANPRRIGTQKLFFDAGFIDQHHGDVVTNGVYSLALDALEGVLVLVEFDRGFTQRTNQDLK